jgi:hypothetical protein
MYIQKMDFAGARDCRSMIRAPHNRLEVGSGGGDHDPKKTLVYGNVMIELFNHAT